MHRTPLKTALILSVLLLSACAHLAGMDMHKAEIGMTREQAIASLVGNPTPYSLKSGATEYVLFRMFTGFTGMYGDYPYDVLFIRLEDGKVVDRGLVGKSEEEKIKQVSPTFVLREWQAKGRVESYHGDHR